MFKNETVVVVGGGDAAIEESLFLSRICSKTYLIHRRNEFRASYEMQKKLNKSKVQVIFDSIVVDVLGRDFVTGVLIKNVKTNEQKQIDCAAMFVAIGHTPETEIFKGQLEVDDQGYFITNGTPETKIPGVFVCGDCADKVFRQAVTAAGTGCQAAILAHRYLESS